MRGDSGEGGSLPGHVICGEEAESGGGSGEGGSLPWHVICGEGADPYGSSGKGGSLPGHGILPVQDAGVRLSPGGQAVGVRQRGTCFVGGGKGY